MRTNVLHTLALSNQNNMTQAEHKQYLIDSIVEMEAFIDKIIGKLYEGRETLTESSVNTFNGIIDRKKANIAQFKELLSTQYNYSY